MRTTGADHTQALAGLRDALDRALWGEVAPLYRHAVDADGFVPILDMSWCPIATEPRGLVHAARMTWTAAELARRCGVRGEAYRDHARHGACTLLERFADPVAGGMFWETGRAGGATERSRGRKHAYGMAFGVYALANAGEALDDERLIDAAFAQALWLDRHGHDGTHAGYAECFERDGSAVRNDPDPGDEMGRPSDQKSMNAHLHVMEAFTRLHEVRPEAWLGARIVELVDLFLERMVAPPGRTHLFFAADWTPVDGPTSYGHDLEIGYLLLEAVRTACPDREAEVWEVARMLGDHAIEHGVDPVAGGLANEGPPDERAPDETRMWWAQAEAINACALLHERYGHETDRYLRALLGVWGFAERHLIDHERGGWRWSCDRDGRPTGPEEKVNRWKTAYHTARAMIETRERLDRIIDA